MRSGTTTFYLGEIIARINNRKKPRAEHLVNGDIPYKKVFVLSPEGEKLGVMDRARALQMASDQSLDLVIISNNPKQPVAKVLDYGKFKYNRKKKQKESKAKQTTINNREVRLTPMIGIHDLMVKSKKAREFLLDGDRVKVSLKFRGREMARKELGYDKLDEFFNTLSDIAKIDKPATLNGGRFLDLHLSRDKTKKQKEAPNAKDENKISFNKEN
ncbi:MAG: translation initiation factor IF-3 [Mycoplasmataceae bacterium]|nr:translation initiation factor IF-3 [Mycoplasmataceae bacterium]